MHEHRESLSPAKEKLLALEATGKFVFHGSPNPNIEALEPRQATTFENGVEVPDDKPAVHATSYADVAIFMALINKDNCPHGYDSGFEYQGKPVFYASQKTIDQLTPDKKAFIYVFDREKFAQRGKLQVICYEKVEPNEMIEISAADLPSNIEVRNK